MATELRVATVGAGYFSQFHYDAWRRIPDVSLEALCERDPSRRDTTRDTYGIARAYDDVERMLDEVRPDLLDIITPPDTHHELVRHAVERGIPVICQKPLAPTLAEAQALVALADSANVRLIVHENFRFMPWYRHASTLLRDGRFGAPHSVSFRLRPGDGQGPRAYLDRQPYFQQMPRFLIHETGIHLIDTFRYLMGEVRAVYASLRRMNPIIAGEDAGYALFEFGNGATGLFDGNRLNDHSADNCRLTMGEMLLEGSAGVLRLDGFGRLWLKPHGKIEREENYTWEPRGYGGDCVRRLQQHVVDHLLRDAPVENTGREYLNNLRIEEALYESNESERRIELCRDG